MKYLCPRDFRRGEMEEKMTINLQKGQKINLSKKSCDGLNKVMVGLGWDEVPQKRGFFDPKPQDIDCDAFAILL